MNFKLPSKPNFGASDKFVIKASVTIDNLYIVLSEVVIKAHAYLVCYQHRFDVSKALVKMLEDVVRWAVISCTILIRYFEQPLDRVEMKERCKHLFLESLDASIDKEGL